MKCENRRVKRCDHVGTASFTVKLAVQPVANVTISVTSSNTAEGTVNVSSLTFTTANWNVAQTVIITGVDDSVDDGDIGYTIVLGAASSPGNPYDGVDPTDVSVTNKNDDAVGFKVSPTSGSQQTKSICCGD